MEKHEPDEIPISDLTNSVMIIKDSNSMKDFEDLLFRSQYAVVVGEYAAIEYLLIPNDIVHLKKVKYLALCSVDVDNLADLNQLSITHLGFEKIIYSDSNKLIAAIEGFKNLKEVFYDQSLPKNVRDSIRIPNLEFTEGEEWVSR